MIKKVAVFDSVNNAFSGPIRDELAQRECIILNHPKSDDPIFSQIKAYELMQWCDVAFFDFLQLPFHQASMFFPEKPIVARLHGLEVYDPFLKQINWSRIHLVLSPAQKLRFDTLIAPDLKYWTPRSQTILPIGVDISPTTKPHETFGLNIGFVAVTPLPRKRLYTTLETFYDLCKESKQKWTLNIRTSMKPTGFRNAESREYRNFYGELLDEAGDMNLAGTVVFHDYSTPEAYRKWLSGMDVFWCNSMQEGYSQSTVEAMSYGAYPLVHRWKGAFLTFPPENLFFSQRELVDKTIAWDNASKEMKQKLSFAAQRIVAEKHDEEVVAKKIADLIMAADFRAGD